MGSEAEGRDCGRDCERELGGGVVDGTARLMAKAWFSMDATNGASKLVPRNEGGTVARVEILGPIGGWDVSGSQFLRELSALGEVDTIDLRVHSPGGEVLDGWAIANGLKNHPAKVVARVEGMAASMGSVVLMAADEVEMPKNSYVMIHNVTGGVWGEADELRSAADLVEKLQDDIIDFYAGRTGIERDEVAEMMRVETWMNGEEAVALGFADRMLEPVSAAAVVRGIEIGNRFENMPTALAGSVDLEEIEEVSEEDPVEPDEVEAEDEEADERISDEERLEAGVENSVLDRIKMALGFSSDGGSGEKSPTASAALVVALAENKSLDARCAALETERNEFAASAERLSAEMLTVEEMIAGAGFTRAEAIDLPSPADDADGVGFKTVLDQFESMSAGPGRSAFLRDNEGEILRQMKGRG